MTDQLRIGILQADSVLMIMSVLGSAASKLNVSVTFVTYDVEHGVYPADDYECDGYVITGSKKSVYDDEPWIQKLTDYVRRLHEKRIRIVGLCFGHQLVAEALGGKTIGADVGWGAGLHASQVESTRWFMEPAADSFTLLVSHKDQVVRLPEGAELLASNDFCPNSMYSIDDHVFCMQGHPEFLPAYSADLIEMRKDILGQVTYEEAKSSLSGPLMSELVCQWIIRFLSGNS
jgi:GMP synthase-like glutamine amidotransferase